MSLKVSYHNHNSRFQCSLWEHPCTRQSHLDCLSVCQGWGSWKKNCKKEGNKNGWQNNTEAVKSLQQQELVEISSRTDSKCTFLKAQFLRVSAKWYVDPVIYYGVKTNANTVEPDTSLNYWWRKEQRLQICSMIMKATYWTRKCCRCTLK